MCVILLCCNADGVDGVDIDDDVEVIDDAAVAVAVDDADAMPVGIVVIVNGGGPFDKAFDDTAVAVADDVIVVEVV